VLNGHVDVVPAGDLGRWSVAALAGTVRDGRVYGRGSADMKGGLCCALFAVGALRDAGVRPRGSVLVQSVVGEEDGGIGTLAAIGAGTRAMPPSCSSPRGWWWRPPRPARSTSA
jgi:acetylornithine deacetylase